MNFSDIIDPATDTMRSAGLFTTDFATPSVRLGVTGLSRAGKTVFITSLVRNLTAGGRLPFLGLTREGRMLEAILEPQPDDDVPRFDYERHVAALTAAEPAWPDSTRTISELRVTIRYQPGSSMGRLDRKSVV